MKSYISLGAITVLLSLHVPFLTVAAPNDLVVEFESTPLFNQSNFLPTEDVTKFVKVTNNTDVSQPIAVEAINESDPDGIGSQLDLTIKEGPTTLYSKTLAQFFSDGEIFLSNVAGNGTQTQYDFTVAFHSDASNDYQGKTLGFDILIGFQGEGGGIEPQQTQDGGGTGGGGGGGGGSVPGLTILHESSVSTLPNELAAIINWITSYKSTSRVVYGTTPGVFDFYNLPNYGYPLSTAESDTPANPNGVTAHQVTVTDLSPNTTYYYRVISHASPSNISREYSFTTLGSTTGTPQQPPVTPAASTPPSSPQSSTPNQPSVGTPQLTNPTGGTVAQGIPQNSLPPSGITPTPISPETGIPPLTPPTNEALPTGASTPTAPSALGSLGAFLGLSSFNSQSFIILLLIAGLIIIFLLYRKKR